ncbi:hypothetical protein PFISCL1PPCAC_5931, partial [Pristionchus fissidentatus]
MKWREHIVAASERTATVEGLDPFTLYELIVQSHNEIGGGSLTHPREAQTDEDSPAGPPLKVQVKAYQSSGFIVQWNPPDVPNGYITNYLIYYTMEDLKMPLDKWKTHDTKSDERTTTIRDLLSDKKYYVIVKAVNAKGESPPSKIVPVKTTSGLPGQVIGLTSTPIDGTRIQLQWDKPVYTIPITGYVITHNSTDGEKEFKLTSPHEKHIVRDLRPSSTYSFRIAAHTSRGRGEQSDETIVTTLNGTAVSPSAAEQDNVPSAPRTLKVELVSPTQVKLSWDPPLHENGQLRGYYVYKERLENGVPVSGQLQKALSIMDAKKLHAEVMGLEPNREYSFRVNAFNRNGDGEFSESRSIVTGGIPPRKPEMIGVTLNSPHDQFPLSAKIEWKLPTLESLDSPIDNYHIWYRPTSQSVYRHETIPATESSTTIGGLWMGEEYVILLGAENGEGLSANSTEHLVTPVGAPDAEPADVQYEIVGTHKMRLYWNPPVEDKRNGKITGYKAILTAMDRDMDERGNKIKTRQEQEVSNNFAIFNVEPNLSYTFKVAASTMKGQGPYSPVLTINPDPSALVGPPSNVRVEAISNSTAVVRWDYPESESVDGFVVKYIHEPTSRSHSETWHQKKVMDPAAKDFQIGDLQYPHKPYAFCVLAVKQNRQGPCSEPPTLIEKIQPKYYVTNLVVEWKTHNSVKVKWDYNGPGPVQFRMNYTGQKEYLNSNLKMEHLKAPGAARDLEHHIRSYLFHSLRASMHYTLSVSVKSSDNEDHWPNTVVVWTDPQAPSLVDTPSIDHSRSVNGQTKLRLIPTSEEYGAISHYWIVVVPSNYTRDSLVHLDNAALMRTSKERKQRVTSNVSITPAKKMKRAREGEEEEEEGDRKRRKREDSSLEPAPLPSSSIRRHRSLPSLNGPYITAEISASEMRDKFRSDDFFIVGDDNTHGSYINFKLENDKQYKVFVRAFAKAPEKRSQLEQRAPMMENSHRLWTDSDVSEPFTPRNTGVSGRGGTMGASQVWLLGPIIALLIIASLIGMLVCWWLRCNKKSVGRGSMRHHGSITKVALGGHHLNGNGGMMGETSKLLSNDYGRGAPIMHPYDQMNGNNSTSLDHLYPIPSSHSRPFHNGNIGNGYTTMPMPSSGGVIGGHSLSHPPVPITELSNHIEKLRANNNVGFIQEFESIETGQQFTWDASSADYNKHKNRYANVVAYDHSRVRIDGLLGSDYINANYIDGYERERAYIATQGPLSETADDFWRMVWEEGSCTIVMLTNLEEQNRVKCDQYWPTRGSALYGDLEVTILETMVLAHYTMRTMRLGMMGEFREIRHLQYTAWPDHGVPDHPTPFLVFLKRVKTLNPPDAGPIISHCSAGIGRTGAFIVIDIMLERLRYEHTIDIFGCVTALRSQRSYMVQIDDQYMFIHDAVLDAVLSGSTEVPSKRLSEHMNMLFRSVEGNSNFEQEYRQLTNVRVRDARCIDANSPVNRTKNRSMAVVPYDANRVRLTNVPGVDGSDYINASWIDGYRERCAYIATQAPADSTITDFWRMIWEDECGVIVVLKMSYEGTGREHSQSRLEYWPSESGVQFGHLVVEPIAEYNMPQYILREFKVSDLQSQLSRTVRHFEYTEWPELNPAPKPIDLFIDFIQQVHKTKSQFGVDGPIVVHCSTGAGRTGVFIALAQIIDRIRLEGVVDVFTTAKLLRTERAGMIQEREHYQFLYMAALEFV